MKSLILLTLILFFSCVTSALKIAGEKCSNIQECKQPYPFSSRTCTMPQQTFVGLNDACNGRDIVCIDHSFRCINGTCKTKPGLPCEKDRSCASGKCDLSVWQCL